MPMWSSEGNTLYLFFQALPERSKKVATVHNQPKKFMLTSAVSKYANDNEDKTSIFYAKKKNLDEKLNCTWNVIFTNICIDIHKYELSKTI